MKKFAPIAVCLVLAFTTYRVYALRVQWASGDMDPEQLALLKENLSNLPTDLGAYQGEAHEVDSETIRNAGADVYGSILYRDKARNLYRLYVGGAIASEENFHAPTYCMPAAGWEVLEENTLPIPGWEGEGDAPEMRRLARCEVKTHRPIFR